MINILILGASSDIGLNLLDLISKNKKYRIGAHCNTGFKRLKKYSTNNKKRFKIFSKNLIRKNWIPDLITTQNPWGEALPAWIISKILHCSYLPQIHTDISSKFWIKENYLLNSFRKLSAKFILNNGDMYIMSEKTSGFDWRKRSIKTLRHAAGEKYVK